MEKLEQKTPGVMTPRETAPKVADKKIERKNDSEMAQKLERTEDGNPDILPVTENAEHDEFTPEQIEEARLEMESELL